MVHTKFGADRCRTVAAYKRQTDTQTDRQTHRHTHTLGSIATYSVKMTEYKKQEQFCGGLGAAEGP